MSNIVIVLVVLALSTYVCWIYVNVVDGMESSGDVRVDGIFELLSLTHSRRQKTQNSLRKESQNSIHIKIMYKRIYDFK